jgi:hypothetical protein
MASAASRPSQVKAYPLFGASTGPFQGMPVGKVTGPRPGPHLPLLVFARVPAIAVLQIDRQTMRCIAKP